MPKAIIKKCQPPYFQQILDGTKRFEVRLNYVEEKDIEMQAFLVANTALLGIEVI
jgi:ASC-1-like (ASCH) protein